MTRRQPVEPLALTCRDILWAVAMTAAIALPPSLLTALLVHSYDLLICVGIGLVVGVVLLLVLDRMFS